MDRLIADGSLGDNESFLSPDDGDHRDRVGKGMINLIFELSNPYPTSFSPFQNYPNPIGTVWIGFFV